MTAKRSPASLCLHLQGQWALPLQPEAAGHQEEHSLPPPLGIFDQQQWQGLPPEISSKLAELQAQMQQQRTMAAAEQAAWAQRAQDIERAQQALAKQLQELLAPVAAAGTEVPLAAVPDPEQPAAVGSPPDSAGPASEPLPPSVSLQRLIHVPP